MKSITNKEIYEITIKNSKFIGVIIPIESLYDVKDNINKKTNIVVIEINLDKINIIKAIKRKYEEFSKYQSVEIDISVLVDREEKYSSLEKY